MFVQSQTQEAQCGFHPGHGTLDQLYMVARVLEGAWEFVQPFHMCFVDLEKVCDHAFQRGAPGIWVRWSASAGQLIFVLLEQYIGLCCQQ